MKVCAILIIALFAFVWHPADSTISMQRDFCNDVLAMMDNADGSQDGVIKRMRAAFNRVCTAMDLIRHGINPIELLGPGKQAAENSTSTATEAPTTTSTTAPGSVDLKTAGSAPVTNPPVPSPLEVVLKYPKVNVIIPHSPELEKFLKSSRKQDRINKMAVDAPRYLLPKDFDPFLKKRFYPNVYEVETKFDCKQQPYLTGVYADMSLSCKVFHFCVSDEPHHNRTSFYCPDDLIFNQAKFQCDYPNSVNCHESYKSFANNAEFTKNFDIKYVVLGKME